MRNLKAFVLGAILLAGALFAPRASGQPPLALPFAPGERLTYTGRVHLGLSGRGILRIDGPTLLRGTTTWELHSDMEGRIGPIKGTDRSASWFDPTRMATLRYTTRERHLVSRHDEDVEVFPDEHRWRGEDGSEGRSDSESPLDELSFLYYLRTLSFADGQTQTFTRHFDVARSPTIVRFVGREDVDVEAGRFHSLVVEMRVRDARRYKGEGVIRINLSDDACRLPLVMASDVPGAGKATLMLASYEGVRQTCAARQ